MGAFVYALSGIKLRLVEERSDGAEAMEEDDGGVTLQALKRLFVY